MQTQFRGMGVAMVTPFTAEGKVDYKSLEKLTNHLINGNTDYLVVMGTTGESVTMGMEEKRAVLDFIIEVNAGRLPIVFGLGGNNTMGLVSFMKNWNWKGVDAILSVSPYYNKPTQAGIIAHYKMLNANSPLPIILYNVPGRTASNMLPETTLQLANECNNIIAIKEASGNLEQCMAIIKNKPKDFLVISGDDALVLPFIACGGDGVISVVGNAFPQEFSEMVHAALNNDCEHAQSIHYRLIDIIHQLFAEGNPGGIKEALQMLKICQNHLRLPLVPISATAKEKLFKLIEKSGLVKLN
jgi:4-hydroxy-tetrahydrodipicolinate synthase